MSPRQPEHPATLPAPIAPPADIGDDDGEKQRDATEGPFLPPDRIRNIVRLMQCRQCSRPLQEPVTLPCAKTLCKECLPQSRRRIHVSYPGTRNRLQGFQCPFAECDKEHALGDCSVDVTLNKVMAHMRTGFEVAQRLALESKASTTVQRTHQGGRLGPSLNPDEHLPHTARGGKLIATYTLAELGALSYEADVSFQPSLTQLEGAAAALDAATLTSLKISARGEMDCQVCYAIFYDPTTTECGHTFCRTCLHRVLDHSPYCPVCRRTLSITPLLDRKSRPSNELLEAITKTFWADVVLARSDALIAEGRAASREFDIPIFVCTLSFPAMPTFLHIFEPRYRLMIRRAMEGDHTFGMVLPRPPHSVEDAHFMELGTLLRIVNLEYFPDGRSLVETVGVSRFRVLRHGFVDGYVVGKIERVDDISLSEEEALEASETTPPAETAPTEELDTLVTEGSPAEAAIITKDNIDSTPTRELFEFAHGFAKRMDHQNLPWLTSRMLAIYGECPNDPAVFPWWFASILPVKELEKYALLGTSSVRERLKICCRWTLEWGSSRW